VAGIKHVVAPMVVAFAVATISAGSRSGVPVIGRAPEISAAERDAGFTFGPSAGVYDRQLIEQAVAGADPRARALIARVDGITTIEIGQTVGASGITRGNGHRFEITFDLGSVQRDLGVRGVNRLVLHELGHVVDGALVSEDLNARLDAAVPPGVPCQPGSRLGACAPQAERFAETFAKWAMHDIGVNLYIGYAVPPPADLDAWATPLAELAGPG
jgi:hypothetical protein